MIDESLIGGFVLNVGDQQVDASIKNKLRTLTFKFDEKLYVRE